MSKCLLNVVPKQFPQGKILHYDIYLGEEVLTNDTEPLSSLILIHNDSSTSIKKVSHCQLNMDSINLPFSLTEVQITC